MGRWDQYPPSAWGPESESAGRRRLRWQWKSCHSGQLVVVRCVLWILARLSGICSFSLVAGPLRLCFRQATCEIGLKKWLRCIVPRAHLLPLWIENFLRTKHERRRRDNAGNGNFILLPFLLFACAIVRYTIATTDTGTSGTEKNIVAEVRLVLLNRTRVRQMGINQKGGWG